MKENGSIEIKNGEIDMEIDKDMIMGGAIFTLLIYMLALCVVEIIQTGGLLCTI